MDQILSFLLSSGTLGVLCAMLLLCIAVLGKVIKELFHMYHECHEKRMENALAFKDAINSLTLAINGIREMSRESRGHR